MILAAIGNEYHHNFCDVKVLLRNFGVLLIIFMSITVTLSRACGYPFWLDFDSCRIFSAARPTSCVSRNQIGYSTIRSRFWPPTTLAAMPDTVSIFGCITFISHIAQFI